MFICSSFCWLFFFFFYVWEIEITIIIKIVIKNNFITPSRTRHRLVTFKHMENKNKKIYFNAISVQICLLNYNTPFLMCSMCLILRFSTLCRCISVDLFGFKFFAEKVEFYENCRKFGQLLSKKNNSFFMNNFQQLN